VLSECKSKRHPVKPGGAAMSRRPRIFAAHIRSLGGVVSVHVGRDRIESAAVYHIAHVSRGGDCCWRSSGMHSQDHADAAARVLAEYVGAEVKIGAS
jgi:hypothetical protein